MQYLLSNAKQITPKYDETNKMQSSTFQFFSKITRMPIGDRKIEMIKFLYKMEDIKSNVYEKRNFMYLGVTEWLKSRI